MNFGSAGQVSAQLKTIQIEHHPNKMCKIPIGPTQQLKVKQLST
jgi:hypothetical protein